MTGQIYMLLDKESKEVYIGQHRRKDNEALEDYMGSGIRLKKDRTCYTKKIIFQIPQSAKMFTELLNDCQNNFIIGLNLFFLQLARKANPDKILFFHDVCLNQLVQKPQFNLKRFKKYVEKSLFSQKMKKQLLNFVQKKDFDLILTRDYSGIAPSTGNEFNIKTKEYNFNYLTLKQADQIKYFKKQSEEIQKYIKQTYKQELKFQHNLKSTGELFCKVKKKSTRIKYSIYEDKIYVFLFNSLAPDRKANFDKKYFIRVDFKDLFLHIFDENKWIEAQPNIQSFIRKTQIEHNFRNK